MEKEFINYEIELALKELGFDEPCFGYYTEDKMWRPASYSYEGTEYPWNSVWPYTTAPTFSQAFRWFREKHNLKGHIEAVEYLDETPDTYHWCVFDKFNSGYDQLTYEEAELECLKKLIEIVKKRSNE